jgi:hypothetical protein
LSWTVCGDAGDEIKPHTVEIAGPYVDGRANDEQYHGNHHAKLSDDPSFLKNGIDTPSAGRASQIMATATQIMAIPMQPD